MATDSTKKNMIDLYDHVCQPPFPGDEAACFCELRTKQLIVMPCSELGWCPYGSLAEVFPANSSQAKRRHLSDHRLPMTCSITKRHCPAFYLAVAPLLQQDPLAACWEEDGTPDCVACKVNLEGCPQGSVWRRHVMITEEHIALREVEAAGLGRDFDFRALLQSIERDLKDDEGPEDVHDGQD